MDMYFTFFSHYMYTSSKRATLTRHSPNTQTAVPVRDVHGRLATNHQHPQVSAQSSQTAFFLASRSSPSLFSLSRSSARLFRSFSRIARSYSLSSSVRFGARTPSAPAISRPATAVVFSGRLSSRASPELTPLSPRKRPAP